MRIIPIQEQISKEDILNKVFVYPTDTCYGIGCNALDKDLVDRIYRIKERSELKPLSIMVDSLEMFKHYGVVDMTTERLINTYLPGDVTFVVPKTAHIPSFLNPEMDTIAIRIPNHVFSLHLVHLLGVPIITTSANKAGTENPYSIQQILSAFKHNEQPDIIFDEGILPYTPPSTVVAITDGKMTVIRQGNTYVSL